MANKSVHTFFAMLLIVSTVKAELAAPTSSPRNNNSSLGARENLGLLKDDAMIQSLPSKSFRAAAGNDKQRCPGGRFLVSGNNTVTLYTKRNSEGIFFGPGEIISLGEIQGQVHNSIVMKPGTGAVRCQSVSDRRAVQEEGRVVVTETKVEDCEGVKTEAQSVFSVVRDDRGNLKVSFERKSPSGNLKCEYLEVNKPPRPSPERPFAPAVKKRGEG